jgi:HTH-type transcriptional regulator/antitoxin HigA
MELRTLMIKPIRTAADLKEAKARLRNLLVSEDAGLHDDEIEVLSTLIEQFERTGARIDAPSPVAAIKFRMEEAGLSPRQLEPFIGSRARVSEVLSGKRQLSIDMIRSLHEGLGIPYESLISKRSKSASVEDISAPTIHRLNALGFEVDRHEIPAILSALTHRSSSSPLLRKTRTQRAASKTNQSALLLWQAAVLRKSESQPLAENFDRSSFGRQTLRVIARLSARPDGPLRALRRLGEWGILTVILPPLPGTFLDGAAMIGKAGNPVIGLTLRHDRIDSFWFTLLHELAHIALHYDQLLDRGAAFVDDMEIHSEDVYEREADQLAGESLIPDSILSQVHWSESTTQDEIVAVSVRARIHVTIVAGRWQRDHQNYKKFARLIERGTVRAMFGLSHP